MAFLIVIIIIVIVGFVFISKKMGDFEYRAKQEILKGTGISNSNINAKVNEGIEKKRLAKFLEEHPEYTEESIKDLFKDYMEKVIKKAPSDDFTPELNEKIQKDTKLDKLQTMNFVRVNVNYYTGSKVAAIIVYADNKDEYNIYLTCAILEEKLQLEKYQIQKGAVIGF